MKNSRCACCVATAAPNIAITTSCVKDVLKQELCIQSANCCCLSEVFSMVPSFEKSWLSFFFFFFNFTGNFETSRHWTSVPHQSVWFLFSFHLTFGYNHWGLFPPASFHLFHIIIIMFNPQFPASSYSFFLFNLTLLQQLWFPQSLPFLSFTVD